VLEALLLQPAAVPGTPSLLAREEPAVAQQEGADLALLDTDLLRGGRACPDEAADRLVRRIRDPDLGQLAGAQEAGQGERVAPVGLDPVARFPRDQRRRDDGAMVPEPGEEPVQAVAGRAGLVADAQRARRAPPCMKTARWRVAMAELGFSATARSVSSR
jgi:hypothetical protein